MARESRRRVKEVPQFPSNDSPTVGVIAALCTAIQYRIPSFRRLVTAVGVNPEQGFARITPLLCRVPRLSTIWRDLVPHTVACLAGGLVRFEALTNQITECRQSRFGILPGRRNL